MVSNCDDTSKGLRVTYVQAVCLSGTFQDVYLGQYVVDLGVH